MDSSTRIQMQSEIESEDEERKKKKLFGLQPRHVQKMPFYPLLILTAMQ
jgi:hypothetical protein